jgi:hypothetical protein
MAHGIRIPEAQENICLALQACTCCTTDDMSSSQASVEPPSRTPIGTSSCKYCIFNVYIYFPDSLTRRWWGIQMQRLLHKRLMIPYQRVLHSTRRWQGDFFSAVRTSGDTSNTSEPNKLILQFTLWKTKILQFTLWKTKITSILFLQSSTSHGGTDDEGFDVVDLKDDDRVWSRCPWCFTAIRHVTTTDLNSGGIRLQLGSPEALPSTLCHMCSKHTHCEHHVGALARRHKRPRGAI